MQAASPLISVDELAERLAEVSVLDVRYRMGGPPGAPEYAAGHVPGAAYVDLDTALAAPPGPRGRHPLPEVDVFEAAMRAAGVSDDRPVVVYDDWQGRAAARCWWLLRWAGHADVRVLDGGWAAWRAAGGEVSTVARPPGRATSPPGPDSCPTLEADDVLASPSAASWSTPATRSASAVRWSRSTRWPATSPARSTSRPARTSVPTARSSRPRSSARSTPRHEGREVAAYCGSGVTAAHDLLAMAVAGIDGALYPGSWSEWVTDPERPVATGSS